MFKIKVGFFALVTDITIKLYNLSKISHCSCVDKVMQNTAV